VWPPRAGARGPHRLSGGGQQSISSGGYTLGELGISIAGRGVVMTRNYRNTREIATFAALLVSVRCSGAAVDTADRHAGSGRSSWPHDRRSARSRV
jgi:hypothetical protein